jgi:UDP-2,3-diacylglucosamine pyrophosphatase LpxH
VFDAVILSDLHLGSRIAQVAAIDAFLHSPAVWNARRLILAGDILDSTRAPLSPAEWGILSWLRYLSTRLELVWLAGNHDHDAEPVADLVGATWWTDGFDFQSARTRVLVTHGDSYDHWLHRHRLLTWLADGVYSLTQRVSPALAVWLKHRSKATLHIREAVRAGALIQADMEGADVVVCGHTHGAEYSERYVNSGCWTEPVCHWVSVERGEVRLREWPERKES